MTFSRRREKTSATSSQDRYGCSFPLSPPPLTPPPPPLLHTHPPHTHPNSIRTMLNMVMYLRTADRPKKTLVCVCVCVCVCVWVGGTCMCVDVRHVDACMCVCCIRVFSRKNREECLTISLFFPPFLQAVVQILPGKTIFGWTWISWTLPRQPSFALPTSHLCCALRYGTEPQGLGSCD